MAANIEKWEVEDAGFWSQTGKKIANKNLWISIPALLLAFSVWMMWAIISTKMKDFGFNFGMITPDMDQDAINATLAKINGLYYTLPAIAGLAGATLRIPNSFLIAIGGGRNVIFLTTLLLIVPVIGTGIALSDVNTPYMTFAVFAALSGFGGGNFASSMSNISFFFPKRIQGTSLGLNAGIGNLGVGVMQKVIPWAVGVFLFSAMDKEGVIVNSVGLAGVQNAAWIWVPFLILSTIAVFFGMNNLKSATPELGGAASHFGKTLMLILLGIISAGVGSLMLIKVPWADWGMKDSSMWVVLPVVIILTVQLMKFLSPREIKASLKHQFVIFKDKHNWIMTILYVMTFGSFIGFSAGFPKLCQDVFVYSHPGDPSYINPNAPDYLMWVFLGPVIGALIRPVGGWLSDKVGSGSRVTTFSTIAQIIATLAVAYFVKAAKGSATPEDFWWPFFICFMILFMTTGIGNGSTFRSIPYIFKKELAGPVLGWTSAIAAYGAFIIPKVFGQQITLGTPEVALYGFAIYYVICLGLNFYYYDRKGSAIKC